jgi:MSHA biogenesis protein MshJ
MKRLWLAYSARYEAMSWRERLLVGAAVVLPSVYLVYAIFVGPALTERRTLEAQVLKQRAQIAALEKAMQEEQSQRADPDAGFRQREAELRMELAQADEQIKALYRSLVPAQRVPVLLREMVARDSALQILSLRTLPLASLMPEAAGKPSTGEVPRAPQPSDTPREPPERGVYKHGVEITVSGSYSALHAYLARLERAPSTMYWWRAHLVADDRAGLTMTLTIYTLSLDKAWFEV